MANKQLLPNAIIAGTNKAGTTSVFRYLGDHPEVCSASVKETRFFTRFTADNIQKHLSEYSGYFRNCSPDTHILIEASPQYLQGGIETAKLIHSCVPGAKLVFILREPADRILSFVRRHYQRKSDFLSDLSAGEFVDKAILIANGEKLSAQADSQQIARQVHSVQYGPLLKAYSEIFPKEQIYIDFFDHLMDDTRNFMIELSKFLEINVDFFLNYTFHIENKTRSYRFRSVQRMAFQVNRFLEPLLNSSPVLRRKLRNFYNALNQTRTPYMEIDPSLRRRLRDAFAPHNAALGKYLTRERPEIALPEWLQ